VRLSATLVEFFSGDPISGARVVFTVNGTSLSGTTNSSGVVSVEFTPSMAGPATITATYAGGATSAAVTGAAMLTVAPASSSVGVTNVSGAPGSTVTLSATLRGVEGINSVLLAGETINFRVNGAVVAPATTGSNGTASLNYMIPPTLTAGASVPIVATFAGSADFAASSGTGTLTVTGASGVAISGTVTLQSSVNEVQPITFQIQPAGGGTTTTQTVTLSTTGGYTLTGIPAGTYNIAAKGDRWLQAVALNVDATSGASGVNLTLLPGDLNGDNQISLADLLILLKAYGSTPSSSNWNPVADLNCDGQVSLTDLLLLLKNYGKVGQTLP
jgi:hypothetical protein